MEKEKTWGSISEYSKEVINRVNNILYDNSVSDADLIKLFDMKAIALKYFNMSEKEVEDIENINVSEDMLDNLSEEIISGFSNFVESCKNLSLSNYTELSNYKDFFNILLPNESEYFNKFLRTINTYFESCNNCVSKLDNVGDGLFNTMLKLVNHPKFKYEIGYNLEKGTVVVFHNVRQLCGKLNLDYNVLSEILDSEEAIYKDTNLFGTLNLREDSCNRITCMGVLKEVKRPSICPYCYQTLIYALCLLKEYNMYNSYVKERKEKGTTYYPFEWKPEYCLKKVPQHLFDLAMAIEENGLVRVNPELCLSAGKYGYDKSKLKSNKLYIDLYNIDCNFMSSYNSLEDFSKLLPIKKRVFRMFKGVDLTEPLYVNDNYSYCGYSCKRECCIILLAGYIHYLRVTNQMDIIDEDRAYYKENEVEILKEISLIHSEMVSKFNDKYISKLLSSELGKKLMQYSDNADGIEELVASLCGDFSENISGVIESEKGLNEDKFISDLIEGAISEGLVSEYKHTIYIPSPDEKGNFSVSKGDVLPTFLSTLNIEVKPYGKPYQDKAERWVQSYMIPNVNILSLHNLANILSLSVSNKINTLSGDNVDGTFNNLGEKIEKGIGHYNLKKNGFYIINGISEFLKLYRKSKDYNDMGKAYNLYNYMIEVLCKYDKQAKLFLCGTEEELKSLFALDSRFAYIFKLRVKFKPLSIESLFDKYKKNLKSDVHSMLYMEKDFYSRFENYIAVNRSLMPFKNYDLCAYLSSYSNQNSMDKVELPPDLYKRKTLEESLSDIIGLDSVKKKVYEFEAFSSYYNKAKSLGKSLPKQNLHMVFTGNPGCGKTTIARIMAKMLYDIGLLKENKLVEVDRKDLVGRYAGQTAPKTHEVIERAMGGVLFIDEAYSLTAKNGSAGFDSLGQEAIATLIKDMEDRKGEFVVIFAGYKDEMKTFVDSNPGIASRIGYTFDFEDYTISELIDIFKLKVSLSGLCYDEACMDNVLKLATYFKSRKNFGNGRFVDKLLQECIVRHSVRMSKLYDSSSSEISDNFDLLTVEDIPTIEDLTGHQTEKSKDASELLNSLIGLESIKKSMSDFENFVLFGEEAKKKGLKVPSQNLHMLFTGNPGCGKTTVARIVARILFDAGVIHENKVIEVERKDLVAGWIGQTAPKTAEVIDKAMGGVLFIDEAYSLAPSDSFRDFGQEAISTLIKAMEDHKGEFVVIFAGYKKEMHNFIESNSGIASRIGYSFDFPDYSSDELQEIFMLKMRKSGFTVTEEAKNKSLKLMNFFVGVENIGNGRFVDKVVQETLLNHSRLKNEDISVISEEAIPSIQEMSESVYSVAGFINPDNIKEKKLRKTAIHELGHAMVSVLIDDNSRIKNITINPKGSGSLGHTLFLKDKSDYTQSKSELLKDIKVYLGGLANEEVVLGEFENGGTSDLEKCTTICNNMISRFGMSSLGLCQLNPNNSGVQEIIITESNKILGTCFEEVKVLLREYKDKTLIAVDYLMEHRDMSEEKLKEILFGE